MCFVDWNEFVFFAAKYQPLMFEEKIIDQTLNILTKSRRNSWQITEKCLSFFRHLSGMNDSTLFAFYLKLNLTYCSFCLSFFGGKKAHAEKLAAKNLFSVVFDLIDRGSLQSFVLTVLDFITFFKSEST
jgi:hypothetical protein